MRKLALLLVLALPLLAARYDSISSGDDGPVYFERDGVRYVIHDPATIEKVERIVQPQVELGKQQAALGEQQAAIGQKQAEIGRRQAELGVQQISARGEHARRLQRRQQVLSEEQNELAEQQRPLAEQQRILGEKQREASRIAKPKLEKIFEEALRSGVAKRR
jgi:hypothetical protein